MESRSEIRSGLGYDIHQLVPDRALILGGVRIPYHLGLKGHSDADVLLHAITDAILGTIAAGDIGILFPDTAPGNKNRNSADFIHEALRLLKQAQGELIWVDVNIIAEQPRISDHRESIILKLSEVLTLNRKRISVKAKTAEKLGPVGRGEAIEVQAIVTARFYESE